MKKTISLTLLVFCFCYVFLSVMSDKTFADSIKSELNNQNEQKESLPDMGIRIGDPIPASIKLITVSSYLVDGTEYDYSLPNGMSNSGKKNPCWCEGKPDAGLGEWVKIEFNLPDNGPNIIHGFYFIAGASLENSIYYNNNRIKKMEVAFSNGLKRVVELPDNPKMHYITLPHMECEWVKLTILEVYQGAMFDDTCIGHIFPYRIKTR